MRLLFFFILSLVCIQTKAAAPRFDEANKLFEERKYKEAIAAYNSIAGERGVSPNLLFNLGNAAFRDGDLGVAVFNYRRAELLAPRDPDIQANLSFARDTVGAVPIHGPAHRGLTYFTLNEISAACLVVYWLFAGCLIAGVLKPSIKLPLRSTTFIMGATFVISLAFLLAAYHEVSQPEAVVLAREAPIRYGPLEESQTQYTARSGTELRILEKKDNWLQVADGSNRIGWINASAVAVIPKPGRS
jgi:hypothetical protein